MSYPVPEPVLTPRAREGLRTVVPTIFPPSAVNRGESVHIRSLEPERRYRPLQHLPKKRGRTPKQSFPYDEDDGGTSAEPYAKRSKAAEAPEYRRLHPHREAPDHGLIQLTRRFQEETTITPKPCGERCARGAALRYSCVISPDVRESDPGAHRTGTDPQRDAPQTPRGQGSRPAALGLAEHDPSWTPRFSTLDTVTVTDVTVNLLTVTVRESSSDKGFFRKKR